MSCSVAFILPAGTNLKKAYQEHYEGSLLYAEGFIKKANQKFKRAYQILPDNFYFALAYGLSEGRLGNKQLGIDLIHQANKHLPKEEDNYDYKRSVASFMAGMVYAYNQDYDAAFQQIQTALSNLPDSASVKSIMLNNLGYLQLLNQSRNQHETRDSPAHLHIRKHDLEDAHFYFQQALKLNPENGVAYANYKTISDTLGLAVEFNKPSIEAKKRAQTDEPTFLYMDEHIRSSLELGKYEELAFLVDVSGSMVAEQVLCMADDRFGVMKTLSRKIVKKLPDQVKLGIGTIGGDCPDAPAKWKPCGSISKDELDTDLRFLIPDGTTPLLTRLLQSPELFSATSHTKKSIFLISDGSNTCRERGLDICAFATELAQKDITVNVLTFLNSSFNNTSAFSEYICLADNTNGKVIYLDNLRCFFETFDFDLTTSCQLTIPEIEKSYCWGDHIETLWMYSPKGK